MALCRYVSQNVSRHLEKKIFLNKVVEFTEFEDCVDKVAVNNFSLGGLINMQKFKLNYTNPKVGFYVK